MPGMNFPAYMPAVRQDRNELYDMLPSTPRECAYALDAKYNAPPRLIYTAILGVLTAAIGPLYTVKTPDWHALPISSWTMMSFDSGSGKTAIYLDLAKPFQDFAAEQRASHKANLEAYRSQLEQWKFEKSRLQKTLLRKRTTDEERLQIEARLYLLAESEPQPPKERPLIINNFDQESLMAILDGREEAVAIIPNEGDSLLCGRWLSGNASLLNDIHDGLDPPQYRREKKRAMTAEDSFLSMNLFTRPGTTMRFRPVHKHGQVVKSKLVDLGFLARFRVAVDDGAWKSPFLYQPSAPDACIEAFQALLRRFIDRKCQLMESGWPGRLQLELEPQAFSLWQGIVQKVKLARVNEWADIEEFAGKALFHAGSLAAGIHVTESDSLLISQAAIDRAWQFTLAYAIQYREAFAPPPQPSRIESDMARVVDYIRAHTFLIDHRRVELGHICHMLQISPQRIKAVAHHLVHYNLASFVPGQREMMIDVSAMMAPTRHITFR